MNQGERDIRRMQTSVRIGDRRNFRRMFGSAAYYLAFAGCLSLILIVWYFAAHKINYIITFPYIEDVLARFFEALVDFSYFWHHFLITLVRVLKGVGLAVLIGFPVGMLMGFSPWLMRTLAPYINALRQIPITAWVPMAIIWFGLGDGPTIFIITFSTVFVVILNVIAGIQDISPDFYNAVRSMGASSRDVVVDVVLPGCTSGLITGVRMALGGAWMTVMWAEFIATSDGFGYILSYAQAHLWTDTVMAYMALVGIFGFAQDRFVLLLETVLLRWKR